MLEKIEQVLNEKVRPELALHGGDVEVLECADGTVRVRLLGRCSACPSAYLTTEQLIEAELTAALPEVKQVVLLRQVSEDLLAQARAILAHG
ncbi:MAG: NifU family protein [Clostridia bacterium]|nr:NifU family protein [Clostridia bacterium]